MQKNDFILLLKVRCGIMVSKCEGLHKRKNAVKIQIKNAEKALEGLKILAPELGVEIVDSAPRVTLTVRETSKNELLVELSECKAKITYGGGKSRLFRGFAILASWIREGRDYAEISETPIFKLDGSMVDMSRDAVMNVKTVKFMLRKMALMGMNAFMLYTEDTYEIEGRPYFGYMRGRYTKDELRELDAYALSLGIELIPCIQVLGHLATHLRWEAAIPYRDTQNALLVGAEETYALIEDMFKTVSESFTSKRLHMGMDETHDLATGAFLDKNGYRAREDVYLDHLNRVVELAKKYGFSPMMWSDMFYELAAENGMRAYNPAIVITDEIAKRVPKGVQPVFWDYYHDEEEHYVVNIEKHKLLGENTMFAGGIWMWSGHCPQFKRSLSATPPALEACKKGGVSDVIATVWHNGSECSLVLSVAALAWYASYDYSGSFDIDSIRHTFEMVCPGARYDDFMATEIPEFPHGGAAGLTRALLYNDPLIGLIDAHLTKIEMQEYYREASLKLKDIGRDLEVFKFAFEVVYKLSVLLENKADYGVRLKKAYDAADKNALRLLLDECDVIISKIEQLRDAHRKAWFEHNKPFGWEIHDIRYGGLIMRFGTAKMRISDYLDGKISTIEELDAERIPFIGTAEGTDYNWRGYPGIASVSRFD